MLSMLPDFDKYIENSRKKYLIRSVSSNNRVRNFNFVEETLPGLQKITNDYMGQFRSNKLKGDIVSKDYRKIHGKKMSKLTWNLIEESIYTVCSWFNVEVSVRLRSLVERMFKKSGVI